MPSQACRDYIKGLDRDRGSHAGLMLDRYLRVPVKEKGQGDDSDGNHADDRKDLLEKAMKACERSLLIYGPAFQRYQINVLKEPESTWNYYQTKSRIAMNLSQASSLETSVALHHTYGVPYLPASALKGLTSHYCHNVFGSKDSKLGIGGKYYNVLFGTEDDRGHITFHDGWMEPDSLAKNGLILDVMTPHHGDYYSGKDSAPTDFDSPNPITYLTVAGTFLVHVTCDVKDEQGCKWAGFAMRLLDAALEHWGVGGKTNAGYGLMKADAQKKNAIRSREQQAREEAETAAKLAQLPEFERSIAQLAAARPDKGQRESSFLLGRLKDGQWPEAEKIHVAEIIMSKMKTERRWREQTQKKNPERDSDYQNTLLVIRYLQGKV